MRTRILCFSSASFAVKYIFLTAEDAKFIAEVRRGYLFHNSCRRIIIVERIDHESRLIRRGAKDKYYFTPTEFDYTLDCIFL